MAKQTTKDVREKKGFVLYADDLVAAEELLPDFERRGQLLSMITAYTTGNKLPQVPDLVRASFVYIRNGIIANNAKYDRKREKQAEYNQRQREKLERLAELERAKNSQVPQIPQVEQNTHAAQTTINNSINNGNGTGNGNGNGTDNGYGISNGNRHGNSNGSENIASNISPNTEILKNKSISQIKYTKDDIKKMLEEREIFFKQNWLDEFWQLNEFNYHWKYEPIAAAMAFVKRYPEALKGNTSKKTPPDSAAPPALAISNKYATEINRAADAYEKDAYDTAQRLWGDILAELEPRLPDRDKNTLRKIKAVTSRTRRYGKKLLQIKASDADTLTDFEVIHDTYRSIFDAHVEILNVTLDN